MSSSKCINTRPIQKAFAWGEPPRLLNPQGGFSMSSIYFQKQYHVIYKWTNKINGKYYIGKHSTSDPWRDDYKGSGRPVWKDAKEKYGIENFHREILCFCETEDEVYDKEHELVGLNEVNDPMCYNQKVGGYGAKSGEENHNWKKEGTFLGQKHTEKAKQKQRKAHQGKTLSKEHKQNISKAKQEENNPQSILIKEEAIQIKYDPRLWQWGGVSKIARERGVHRTSISDIKHGRTWKNI